MSEPELEPPVPVGRCLICRARLTVTRVLVPGPGLSCRVVEQVRCGCPDSATPREWHAPP